MIGISLRVRLSRLHQAKAQPLLCLDGVRPLPGRAAALAPPCPGEPVQIIPIPEHQLLVFFVQFVLLLALARLLDGLMLRIGQPSVIGEIFAGVLLGPTVLGSLWPEGAQWLFPPEAASPAMLLVIGWVGILMLLALTGFETDLGLIRQLGRAAVLVAAGSVVVPFAFGLGTAYLLPGQFLGDEGQRTVFALFLATALSISSLPVIAKILSELGLTRRNFGQLTIAAGMANDVVGWLLLGAVASLARSGALDVGRLALSVVGMAVFLVVMFTAGQRLVDRALRRVRERSAGLSGALTVTVVVVFAAGAITQALGVEAVLGAFVAGVVIGRSRFQDTRVTSTMETVTGAVFAPLFFAAAGLRVDLTLLADPVVLLWSVVVIAVASAGKFAGAYIGGRLARLAAAEAFALGAGLNARGALEIVIATVGLSLGILNTRSYTVVVIMAIATSMAAPPLLRAVTRRWQGSKEEQRRLQREETLSNNLLVRPEPVLIPVERPAESLLAGKLIDLAWPADQPATVLGVGSASPSAMRLITEVVERRPVEPVEALGTPPLDAVLHQLQLGYSVVGIGSQEGVEEGAFMSALTDRLLAAAPLPVLVVQSGPTARLDAFTGFSRILVPVAGTLPNRLAQEVAFSAAATAGAELVIAHVVPAAPGAAPPVAAPPPAHVGARRVAGGLGLRRSVGRTALADLGPPASGGAQDEIAVRVLTEAADLAERLGTRAQQVLRHGPSPAAEIVALARELQSDLVVLGSQLHPGTSDRPFLGHFTEQVLAEVPANVAAVAVPQTWRPGTA